MNPSTMTDLGASLTETLVTTLEEMGFVFAIEAGPGEERGLHGIAVEVSFSGPSSGLLWLEVSPQVLPTMTASMLAMDGVPGRVLQMDALGELANVVCGNVLPALAGSRAAFTLGHPEPANGPGPEGAEARSLVILDDGWAEARLVVVARPPTA